MTVVVRRVEGATDREAAYAIRREVFIDEQRVPADEEYDDLDEAPTTVHVVALAGAEEQPVGTARLLVDPAHPEVVHIGRVAVLRAGRGLGVGRALMLALEQMAPGECGREEVRVELSAQEGALDFYRRLGYAISGPRYLDAGIWHRDASKLVASAASPKL